MALPFGAKAPEQIETGHASSAPERPRMMLKLAATTIISAGLFVIVYLIISSGLFSFRELAG